EYLSPYTSDGVTAEWVNKAINAKMGSAAGSAVGAAAGAYAGRKALESVPGGSLIGSFFGGMAGSKAGQNVGRDAAIQASGGWDYIRETSDLSFRSLNDMARWMTTVHGQKSNFQEVLNATLQVYPELQPALASAR
ncbi:MAG TPA: carboxyl-terminal protease-like protein, partial [Alcanivorax sp.]|nr:carboxyl-terminal protease-like protein [Alcanivorax sp.]